MGFYPVCPGRPVYDLGSPLFDQVTIRLPEDRTFTIQARDASDRNKYIQAATLNGQPLDRPWLDHAGLSGGGTLELRMGPRPNKIAARGSRGRRTRYPREPVRHRRRLFHESPVFCAKRWPRCGAAVFTVNSATSLRRREHRISSRLEAVAARVAGDERSGGRRGDEDRAPARSKVILGQGDVFGSQGDRTAGGRSGGQTPIGHGQGGIQLFAAGLVRWVSGQALPDTSPSASRRAVGSSMPVPKTCTLPARPSAWTAAAPAAVRAGVTPGSASISGCTRSRASAVTPGNTLPDAPARPRDLFGGDLDAGHQAYPVHKAHSQIRAAGFVLAGEQSRLRPGRPAGRRSA